jgi:hypothetical protein
MLTFQCQHDVNAWIADIERVIVQINQQQQRLKITSLRQQQQQQPKETKPTSSANKLVSRRSSANNGDSQQQPCPKKCQSCQTKFTASLTTSTGMMNAFLNRRRSQHVITRCATCTRALCSNCVVFVAEDEESSKGETAEGRCYACEALRIAQKQTLTSLDDQQRRILEEIGKLKQTNKRSHQALFLGLFLVLSLVLYLSYWTYQRGSEGMFGMVGLYLDDGGRLGRITFTSTSSRFDWDFSEEATIATAKTLMLDES